MGAMNVQRYLAEDDHPQLVGAVAISSPWCAHDSVKHIGESYFVREAMIKTKRKIMRANNHNPVFLDAMEERGYDIGKIYINLEQMDDYDTWMEFDHVDAGYDTLEEYNHCLCSKPHLERINVPMLSLNSEDDIVLPSDSVPSEEDIMSYDNIIHLNVRSGGHIEYPEGWKPQCVILLFLLFSGLIELLVNF